MTDPLSSPPPAPPTPAPPAPRASVPYKYRGEGTGAWQRFAWGAGRLISRLVSMVLFRLHVSGQAQIPRSGGVLLVTNHQSYLDPWLIGIAPARQIHYMARDSLFKGGFLHYLAELLNAFPVKRGSADLGAIRAAVERLEKGFVVNVFPEGTRSEDGTIGPVAPGVSLILDRCKSAVALQAVIVDGAFEAWPRKAKLPRCFTGPGIKLVYGKPMCAEEWRSLSPDELAARIRRELVNLQKQIGSPHAADSERRMNEEAAKAAAEPARGRGRRHG